MLDKVYYYRRLRYSDFVDLLGRCLFYVDVFGLDFWSRYLGVDYNYLYDVFINFDFRRGFYRLMLRMDKVFGRFLRDLETKEFILYMARRIVRFSDGFVDVSEEFRPSRQQLEFADWVVNSSGQVVFEECSLSEIARAYGRVSVATLSRWYRDPGFLKWFNEYCIEKLGFVVPILKSSIVHRALRKDATLAERRFALEVLGELGSVRGSGSSGLKVYILGKEVNMYGKAEEDS